MRPAPPSGLSPPAPLAAVSPLKDLRREAAWCYTCRWESAAADAGEPVELPPEEHTSACQAWREAVAAFGVL